MGSVNTSIQASKVVSVYTLNLLRSPLLMAGLLLTGVFVSFAVAIYFSLMNPMVHNPTTRKRVSHPQGNRWYIAEDTYLGMTLVYGARSFDKQQVPEYEQHFNYDRSVYYGNLKEPPTDDKTTADVFISYGWPFRAFALGFNMSARLKSFNNKNITPNVEFGIVTPLSRTKKNLLQGIIPIRPIPAGLILDSIIYAAILSGVIVSLRGLLVFTRLKRQRCPLCAYQLHNTMDTGCPECGWNR